jgi:hypothetical protein
MGPRDSARMWRSGHTQFLAADETDPGHRASLLEMAQAWQKLADDAEPLRPGDDISRLHRGKPRTPQGAAQSASVTRSMMVGIVSARGRGGTSWGGAR